MSSSSISVLILDENQIRASIIEAGLKDAGHEDVTILTSSVGIAREIENLDPDVIVIDLENPNRDMLEAMFQLSKSVKRPVAMFVDQSDDASLVAAVEAGVSAYIVDGLKKERVKPILDLAILRFNAFARMESDLAKAQEELKGRKVIDQAKAILMKNKGLSEDEAYKLLRKTAMSQNIKISDVAQSLVTAANLLGPGN
ncbi:ANTAR domain-containing protein [Sneathiella sp. P13V-1]|uniref:ANTAR domain-containing response regulator n=1 Tax=Sneathiella sp. P13V-1 TaxID=2697366 RepID=UPI00187B7062|nr:ANTAR domain-containing response regulator [Sneathiella sp. P13V-1]MBE7637498.1 ANTAR domain-containing protein [Sneathiella sp. P13V-1]